MELKRDIHDIIIDIENAIESARADGCESEVARLETTLNELLRTRG